MIHKYNEHIQNTKADGRVHMQCVATKTKSLLVLATDTQIVFQMGYSSLFLI